MAVNAKNKKIIRRIAIAAQGGAVLGAEQAGWLSILVQHPTIEIVLATGVSAGAFNIVPLAQIFNRHGFTAEARHLAHVTLHHNWLEKIAMPDGAAEVIQTQHAGHELSKQFTNVGLTALSFTNPVLAQFLKHGHKQTEEVLKHPLKSIYSSTFQNVMSGIVSDPEALQSRTNMSAFVEAVNAQTRKGRIFNPEELISDVVLGSAALPDAFHPVMIDGAPYIDGACPGGSNAPFEPIFDNMNNIDAVLVLATNPPYREFQDVNIRTMTKENLPHHLLLSEGLWPFVNAIKERETRLRKTTPPIHIAWRSSGEVYEQKKKLDTSYSFIHTLFEQGQRDAKAWLKKHGKTMHSKPSMTFDGFCETAYRNDPSTPKLKAA